MGVKVENAKVVVNRFGSMRSATPEQISKALLASSLGVKNKAKLNALLELVILGVLFMRN